MRLHLCKFLVSSDVTTFAILRNITIQPNQYSIPDNNFNQYYFWAQIWNISFLTPPPHRGNNLSSTTSYSLKATRTRFATVYNVQYISFPNNSINIYFPKYSKIFVGILCYDWNASSVILLELILINTIFKWNNFQRSL